MSKLLSEEELKTRLIHLTDGQLSTYEHKTEVYKSLIDLVESQKKAFAKYVIGEDNPYKASFYGRRYDIRVRNNLRAEQRERAGL